MGISRNFRGVEAARASASQQSYFPTATVKCEGPRMFRSQAARDVACLLDVNPQVSSWICMPAALTVGKGIHVPDFVVFAESGKGTYVDAYDRTEALPVDLVERAAEAAGYLYRIFDRQDVCDGFRLRNAKDLLRYGGHTTPLGDRVRVLSALDDQGSLTFAECLSMFREGNPVAVLASLILWDFLEVELDEALIGPETVVRRIRR
jgi:hypothetical protein